MHTALQARLRLWIYSKEQADNVNLDLKANGENVYIYQNKYTLPIGYALPQKTAGGWMLELDDPVLVQNSFCDSLGVGQILKSIETVTDSTSLVSADITEDGEYYAYSANPKTETITVSRTESKKTYEHLDRGYLLEQ